MKPQLNYLPDFQDKHVLSSLHIVRCCDSNRILIGRFSNWSENKIGQKNWLNKKFGRAKKIFKKIVKNCRRQFLTILLKILFFLKIFFEKIFFEKIFLLCQIFCSDNFSVWFCSRTNLRNGQSKSTASYDVM